MTTIKEDYVSFETAKLLKEKGFDETCYACYEYFSSCITMYSGWPFEYKGEPIDNADNRIKCPTLQMAMKWLLKKYNIFICVLFLEESGGYGYTIEDIIKKKYIATSKNSSYKEPEEAGEAAIKYCLEHLI